MFKNLFFKKETIKYLPETKPLDETSVSKDGKPLLNIDEVKLTNGLINNIHYAFDKLYLPSFLDYDTYYHLAYRDMDNIKDNFPEAANELKQAVYNDIRTLTTIVNIVDKKFKINKMYELLTDRSKLDDFITKVTNIIIRFLTSEVIRFNAKDIESSNLSGLERREIRLNKIKIIDGMFSTPRAYIEAFYIVYGGDPARSRLDLSRKPGKLCKHIAERSRGPDVRLTSSTKDAIAILNELISNPIERTQEQLFVEFAKTLNTFKE